MHRWGQGQTPTSNPFPPSKYRRHLSAYDKEKCLRCGVARWYHTREGLIPDHSFVATCPASEDQ
jgi:hypothetical protein